MDRSLRLVGAVQELSLARDLDTVVAIVRRASRELAGSDGATFVLRDGEFCHYVDEDAIAPLWRGQRFPMLACISGWAMLHREPVVIEDIYADPRIPADAYRPTFVQSLLMVPIRTLAPIGAIGNYWASHHRATDEQVKLLCALADSTSVAMENIEVYRTLEQRVAQRTAELAESRAELARKHEALLEAQRQKEEMAALIAHDLKSPASGILLSCSARLLNPTLPEVERRHVRRIQASADIINRLALNLVDVACNADGSFRPRAAGVDLYALLGSVVERMQPLAEAREQRIEVFASLCDACIEVDQVMLSRVLQNLLDNALRHNRSSRVQLVAQEAGDRIQLRVIDEGPGIPVALRQQIFDKYVRLDLGGDINPSAGHGLGLTFCRIAVEAHGGRIWVESNTPTGAAFVIDLPRRQRPRDASSQSQVTALA
jgi:signal transduction histidine kinase